MSYECNDTAKFPATHMPVIARVQVLAKNLRFKGK